MNLTILIIYLALQLLLCYYISKKINTESDYLVAGRNLPVIMVGLSLFATWFGAETCIGSSAAVYNDGLSGSRADPFGYSLCLIFSGLLIAPRIWNRKYVTLSDFYRERFGVQVEKLAIWVLSFSSLIWAAAQLRAFAQVVGATTELPVDLTLLISFVFIVMYTMLGGLLGDIITDVVQAVVITVGLLFLLFNVSTHTEGFWQALASVPAERLSFIGEGESWMARIDRWAIPILGSLVAQEIVSRIFSARSKKVAVKACFYSAGIYLALGSIPILLGLIGPKLLVVEGESEQFLIQLAKMHLPPVMVPIFAGALISALLATIDSILLSVSALVSHNYLIPKFNIRDEKKKIYLSRFLVFLAGLIAYIMAVYSSGIYELLEVASSFGTAGILIVTLIGLWSEFGEQSAALAALGAGLVATPIADFVFHSESPFLVSLLSALVAYVAVAFLKPQESPARIAVVD